MSDLSRSKRLSLSLRSFADRIISRPRPASTIIPPVDEPISRHRRRQSLGTTPSHLLGRSFSTRSEGWNARRYSGRRDETRPARRHSSLWLERRLDYAKTRVELQDDSCIQGLKVPIDSGKSWCSELPGSPSSILDESEEEPDHPTSFVDLQPMTFSPSSYMISLSDAMSSESDSWLSLSPSPTDSPACALPAPKPTRPMSADILSNPKWFSIPPEMDEDHSDHEDDWLWEEFVPHVIGKPVEASELTLDWRDFHTYCLESDDSYPSTPYDL